MSSIGKSAEYNPKFSANSEGVASCPKCKNELSESDNSTAENWWYCSNCEHWIITQPSHSEGTLLGYENILLLSEKGMDKKLVEYPGGYIKPYCPKCKKHMWVEKMWWDKSELSTEKDKCRIISVRHKN